MKMNPAIEAAAIISTSTFEVTWAKKEN